MLSQLSLHQLQVLLVLLDERNVTRAARRLGVTQPALSHTLRVLREVLGDALLVPGQGGLVLTRRAAELAPALRRVLRELESTLAGDAAATDPRGWRRTVVLGTWDGVSIALVPALLARFAREAPGLDLDVRPVPPGGAAAWLESGELDIALEVRPTEAPGLRTRHLMDDGFACLVRADHPGVGATLDLDTWLALPHALISPTGTGRSVVDTALEELGHRRRVALRIRYFLAAPLVVARSDLVLTGPRSLCEAFLDMAPLRMFPPPLPLPSYAIRTVWHERTDADPTLRWVRDALPEAVRGGARQAG